MRELSLFTGAGGGLLASHMLGWDTVCAVEIDRFCARRLMQRQNEGHLPPFPIWDDVCTFDGLPWRGIVDVISGGFPCQDISSAGKRPGIDGEKSGLWREFARIIGEVKPRWVFIENSQHLRTRGLNVVLSDLDSLGFDAAWGVLSAKEVGAPHLRKRMWIVAHTDSQESRNGQILRKEEPGLCETTGVFMGAWPSAYTYDKKQLHITINDEVEIQPPNDQGNGAHIYKWGATRYEGTDVWWPINVATGVDDGMAHRVDRTRATGNGQVPRVAAMAWNVLSRRVLR